LCSLCVILQWKSLSVADVFWCHMLLITVWSCDILCREHDVSAIAKSAAGQWPDYKHHVHHCCHASSFSDTFRYLSYFWWCFTDSLKIMFSSIPAIGSLEFLQMCSLQIHCPDISLVVFNVFPPQTFNSALCVCVCAFVFVVGTFSWRSLWTTRICQRTRC